MGSFGDLLRKGKKRSSIKDNHGKWGRCETCQNRRLLYPYVDAKNQTWQICEFCIGDLVTAGGKEP